MMVNLLLRINGSSLSIEKTGEELTSGTVDHNCYLIFEGNTTEWDDFLRNRSAKVVFSTDVTDPINVPMGPDEKGKRIWTRIFDYSENRVINPEYNIWEKISDEEIGDVKCVYSCPIPASVIQAPGFSINLVGYEIDAETQKYSKRLPTNIVYARVYPSVVDGTLEGLNPGVDWADLVPTAISDANEAKNTSNEAKDIATSALSEILHVKEIALSPFTNTVTKSGLDAEKAVRSSGIFNFVEGTTHTQLITDELRENSGEIYFTGLTEGEYTVAPGFNAEIRYVPGGITYRDNLENPEYDFRLRGYSTNIDKEIYQNLTIRNNATNKPRWNFFKVVVSTTLNNNASSKVSTSMTRSFIPANYYEGINKTEEEDPIIGVVSTVGTTVLSTKDSEDIGGKWLRYDSIVSHIRADSSSIEESNYHYACGIEHGPYVTEFSTIIPTSVTEVTDKLLYYKHYDYNGDGKIDETDEKIHLCLNPDSHRSEYSYTFNNAVDSNKYPTKPTTYSLWTMSYFTRIRTFGGPRDLISDYRNHKSQQADLISSMGSVRVSFDYKYNNEIGKGKYEGQGSHFGKEVKDLYFDRPDLKSDRPCIILDFQNLNIPNVNATNISATNISGSKFEPIYISDYDKRNISTSFSTGQAYYNGTLITNLKSGYATEFSKVDAHFDPTKSTSYVTLGEIPFINSTEATNFPFHIDLEYSSEKPYSISYYFQTAHDGGSLLYARQNRFAAIIKGGLIVENTDSANRGEHSGDGAIYCRGGLYTPSIYATDYQLEICARSTLFHSPVIIMNSNAINDPWNKDTEVLPDMQEFNVVGNIRVHNGSNDNKGRIYLSNGNSGLYCYNASTLGVTQNFYVNGNITQKGSINESSLAELKENIKLAPSVLQKIVNSDIYTFNYKADSNKANNYGLVIGVGYNTPTEVLSFDKTGVNLYSMISFAWKGIQELNDKVENLATQIQEIKTFTGMTKSISSSTEEKIDSISQEVQTLNTRVAQVESSISSINTVVEQTSTSENER